MLTRVRSKTLLKNTSILVILQVGGQKLFPLGQDTNFVEGSIIEPKKGSLKGKKLTVCFGGDDFVFLDEE